MGNPSFQANSPNSQELYASSVGTTSSDPFIPILTNRDPTSFDRNYPVKKRWINIDTPSEWILVNFSNTTGQTLANWVLLSDEGADITTLTPNTGGPVTPVNTNINVFGMPAFSAQAMETVNINNELFIEDRTWFTPYVVDQNTNPGERGTFSTIQSAIDAAIADGNAADRYAYIKIRGTDISSPYIENLNIPAGALIYLEGEEETTQLIPGYGVTIAGTGTLGTGSSISCKNIIFSSTPSPAWVISTGVLSCYFLNCSLLLNVTGSEVLLQDCQLFSTCTFSGGTVHLTSCLTNNIALSGAGVILDDCNIGTVALSGTGAALCFDCNLNGDWSGTSSNGSRFYDCVMDGLLGYTGTAFVGGISRGNDTTLSSFFGPGITQRMQETVQGNVLVTTKVAADYQVLFTDYYIGITSTAAPRNMTLPAFVSGGVYPGQVFIFKDESGNAGTNNITITPPATKTIDGAATAVINANYGSISLVFDGTNYFIL